VIDRARTGSATAGLAFRPVRVTELADCAAIWRVSINEYIVRLGQSEIPLEMAPIVRLYTHLQATDPDRFIVATLPDGSGERLVGFAAATVREHLWYLSMLFVLPEFQGAGLGRQLLTKVAPIDDGMVRAVAVDSAQPISNAMYASEGMVPRMPLFSLTGLPRRPEAFGDLPSGVTSIAFDEIVAGQPGGQGHQMLAEAIDAIDRELLGVAHPADHRFLRTESRHGWLYRGPDGTPVGYGYAGEAGRVGPVAIRDEALLGPVLGHLTAVVVPRGAFALWAGGAADRAVVTALQAGFRMDQFPVLLCWDRPFATFSHYLPISPGLL
jgi:GNAT superfamily N-acetyltransferase